MFCCFLVRRAQSGRGGGRTRRIPPSAASRLAALGLGLRSRWHFFVYPSSLHFRRRRVQNRFPTVKTSAHTHAHAYTHISGRGNIKTRANRGGPEVSHCSASSRLEARARARERESEGLDFSLSVPPRAKRAGEEGGESFVPRCAELHA